MKIYLQSMVDDVPRGLLPESWTTFDFESFSAGKRLWDYQQQALRRASVALWRYYGEGVDYRPGEASAADIERKQRFLRWYEDNGLDTRQLVLPVASVGKARSFAQTLADFYDEEVLEGAFRADAPDRLSFAHFVNRMSFWMATGSGKTLVLVKLIEMLNELIRRGEIPPRDILVLAHKDELLQQFTAHVAEFNAARRGTPSFIRLRSLREYATVKRDTPNLFAADELTVFHYRSDNLSNEQKERIVDFRNYESGGGWYVLLDEAHKGDKEDSRRQHIYSILSRHGFLFNFSATFTDPRDLAATVSNFNLSEFVRSGFGKHIALLKQEIRAFRDKDDFSGEEKQKIVLKSLLLLAYVKTVAERVRQTDARLYHEPLLVVFVNSVNTEDADLKLFFRELERIAAGHIDSEVWRQAKDELWDELRQQPAYTFEEEDERVEIDEAAFAALGAGDVLSRIFNAKSTGAFELCERPSDRNELALKLQTADKPFALIKVGDTARLRREELAAYEVNTRFEDEGYFEGLNSPDSAINILLGSRSFYEGWDSNRPNVLNFVNIGTSADAKKFVLQAVGRGVRIEPTKNGKRRLRCLANAHAIDSALYRRIKDEVAPLESIFILGTNREALKIVLAELDKQKTDRDERTLTLAINEVVKARELLIPSYRQAREPLYRQLDAAKFPVAADELKLLGDYVGWVGDNRVLLALHDAAPEGLRSLRDSLARHEDFYRTDGRECRSLPLLMRRVSDYFSVVPEEFDGLQAVGEEINHFRHITVKLAYFDALQEKVNRVLSHREYKKRVLELTTKMADGQISQDDFAGAVAALAQEAKPEEDFERDGQRLAIKHLAGHYYVPLIFSETEKADYIKHIVKTPSEVKFLKDLETYLAGPDNKFAEFDWWLFSKLDQTRDQVYVPYYNGKENRIAYFYPDFIFWVARGNDYSVLFIDPKGTSHADYQQKVDGFVNLFAETNDTSKIFRHGTWKVRFHLFLYTADNAAVGVRYRPFWFDRIGRCVEQIFTSMGRGGISVSHPLG